MEHCQTLKEYAIFIDKCKSYIGDCASVAEGINKAVDECILVNVLKEFLVAHRGEVLEVLLTEFDEEKYVKAMKKEGYDEGYKKNIKCMVQMALEYGEDLETAVSKVSEKLSLSIEEVRTAWEESEIS